MPCQNLYLTRLSIVLFNAHPTEVILVRKQYLKEELTKLRSPELSIDRFCESVKDLQSKEIFEAVLLEMMEINRLYAVENKYEKMEDGLPAKNTAARNYYDRLAVMLSASRISFESEIPHKLTKK